MKTLLYDTITHQISYENSAGYINIPNNKKVLNPSENIISYSFVCVIGIINITPMSKYFFFCSESESLGAVQKEEIFSVQRVEYLQLSDQNEDYMAENIKNLFESLNFYYTMESIEDNFLWNSNMIKNFKEYINNFTDQRDQVLNIEQQIDIPYKFKNSSKSTSKASRNPFSIKRDETVKHEEQDFSKMMIGNVFCGYFESRIIRDNGMLHYIKILSRISTEKIGPRMLSRGVDESGNVSFFVETKFIVKNDVERIEFLILRGSIPLFWSQEDPLKPQKVIFDKDNQVKNDEAFIRHIKKIEKEYGKIVIVDLLGHKKYEKLLSKEYKERCLKNNIDYIHFDLNRYAENIKNIKTVFYSQLNEFLTELKAQENANYDLTFQNIGYKNTAICKDFDIKQPSFTNNNSVNINSEEALSDEGWDQSVDEIDQEPDSSSFLLNEQHNSDFSDLKIIFRVNCMDCLDRTNIGQCLIFNFFDKFKFPISKVMWINNGNALSKMYTGSDALKSELHAKGRLSVLGRMGDLVISANRMINNRFTDKDKQNIIDMILGRKSS